MFRLFFWFFCISIVALVLIGCGHVSSSVKITSFAYQDGHSWKYQGYFTGGVFSGESWVNNRYFSGTTALANGVTVLNEYETDEASVAMSISGLAVNSRYLKKLDQIKNMLAFQVKGFYGDEYSYLIHKETGVYSYGTNVSPTTEAWLVIPFPLEVGTKWRTGGTILMQAVAEEDVTVPAGTFRAIKVSWKEADGRDLGFYDWYADGVGLVKTYCEWETSTETLEVVDGVRYVPSTTEVVESGKNTFTLELYSKNF